MEIAQIRGGGKICQFIFLPEFSALAQAESVDKARLKLSRLEDSQMGVFLRCSSLQ